MGTKAKEATEFKEIKHGKLSLFVSNSKGTYDFSKQLLSDNGLRPLTYKEALSISSELIRELSGKWFWLAEGEIKNRDGAYSFNEKGEIVELSKNKGPDTTVDIWPGKSPLLIYVRSEPYDEIRFLLGAYLKPNAVAPAIVGIKNSSKREGGANASEKSVLRD
jgi:hypothetical protein